MTTPKVPREVARLVARFKPGGAADVLRDYLSLPRTLGEHWLWVALSRVAAGQDVEQVMRDYGWERNVTGTEG